MVSVLFKCRPCSPIAVIRFIFVVVTLVVIDDIVIFLYNKQGWKDHSSTKDHTEDRTPTTKTYARHLTGWAITVAHCSWYCCVGDADAVVGKALLSRPINNARHSNAYYSSLFKSLTHIILLCSSHLMEWSYPDPYVNPTHWIHPLRNF